jgi:hypothetical protein
VSASETVTVPALVVVLSDVPVLVVVSNWTVPVAVVPVSVIDSVLPVVVEVVV